MDASKIPSPAGMAGGSPAAGPSSADQKGQAVVKSDNSRKVPDAANELDGSRLQFAAPPSEVRKVVGLHVLPELANIVGGYCGDPQEAARDAGRAFSVLRIFVHYGSEETSKAVTRPEKVLRQIAQGKLQANADAAAKLREAFAPDPSGRRIDDKGAPVFEEWRARIEPVLMKSDPLDHSVVNAAFNAIAVAADAVAPGLADASRLQTPAQLLHDACDQALRMSKGLVRIPVFAKAWTGVSDVLEPLETAARADDFDAAWPKAVAEAMPFVEQRGRTLGESMFRFFRLITPADNHWYDMNR